MKTLIVAVLIVPRIAGFLAPHGVHQLDPKVVNLRRCSGSHLCTMGVC